MDYQPPKPAEWTWHDQLDSVGFKAQTISGTTGVDYSNTVINGGYTVGTGLGTNGVSATSYPYTISTGTTYANPWATTTTLKGGQLELEGPGADVVVNGRSLITTLEAIQRRLNLLNVNPELEAEWAELRVLGDQYRKLEQHIQDKQATWDRLQAMPPPTVD
jgi:hypothetical protein